MAETAMSPGELAGRNQVVAFACVEAVAGPCGITRLPVLASQAPLVLRRTPDAVYLVGGTAGPIGGDALSLTVTVGAGAFLRVRTAAASIALPGLGGLESSLRVAISVGEGGRLEYLPEPVVVADGARHTTLVSVTLAPGASLVLRDEVLLGRHGEAGGSIRTDLRVSYAGRPLLRHGLSVSGTDPACVGPAVLAGHRAVGTLLLVNAPGTGQALQPDEVRPCPGPEVAVMPLAGPGSLVTALAHDAVSLRRRLRLPAQPSRPDLPPTARLMQDLFGHVTGAGPGALPGCRPVPGANGSKPGAGRREPKIMDTCERYSVP